MAASARASAGVSQISCSVGLSVAVHLKLGAVVLGSATACNAGDGETRLSSDDAGGVAIGAYAVVTAAAASTCVCCTTNGFGAGSATINGARASA